MDEQLGSSRHASSSEMTGSADMIEGVKRVRREAPGALFRALEASWQTSSSASGPRLNRIPAALGHLLPAMLAFFGPAHGASPNAHEISNLYDITLYIALVIFFAVEGALVYALVRFRKRNGAVPGADPRQHPPGGELDGRGSRDPAGLARWC